jgi:hypothetical protein
MGAAWVINLAVAEWAIRKQPAHSVLSVIHSIHSKKEGF